MSKGIYKIPKEEDVLRISMEILSEHGIVNSLKMLTKLVNMRAKSENPDWRIGPKRLKRVLARNGKIKIEVISRESDEELGGEVRCVVCGEVMEPELNKTLYGGVVTLGYRCKHCGYRTDTKKKIPMRYVFRLR